MSEDILACRDHLNALLQQAAPPSPVKKEEQAGTATYRIRFRPYPDIFSSGTDPALLLDELRDL